MSKITVVHLVRHGEADNPAGVLYGRLPGYHLSELGRAMAERLADYLAGRDVVAVISSPLKRAAQTARPIAARLELSVRVDPRLIEASNVYQGIPVNTLWQPRHWQHLRNPFRPSWGEPYHQIAARMLAALYSVAELAAGREAVCVSHQLPIWMLRRQVQGRRLWHNPRLRQCALASLTSFTLADREIVSVDYAEPAKNLLPVKTFTPGL